MQVEIQKEEIGKLNLQLKMTNQDRKENVPDFDLQSLVVDMQITEKEAVIIELDDQPAEIEEEKQAIVDMIQEI